METNNLIRTIKDHFEAEPEVYETAMYAISTININDMVQIAMMSKQTSIDGIPPDSYALMKRFDNGLTLNQFWLDNYIFIKNYMAITEVKANTHGIYIGFGEKENNKEAFKQARAIMLAKLDVLTLIAFLWKGVKFAEKFDAALRLSIQLTPEHEQYFKEKGI